MVRSAASAIGVRIHPGETTLVRIRGASSTAKDIASDCSAPFDAAALGPQRRVRGEGAIRMLRADRLRRFAPASVVHRDAHSLPEQGPSDAEPDAAGGAGHDRGTALQVGVHRLHGTELSRLADLIAALIIFLATYLFLAGAELPFLKLDRPG